MTFSLQINAPSLYYLPNAHLALFQKNNVKLAVGGGYRFFRLSF